MNCKKIIKAIFDYIEKQEINPCEYKILKCLIDYKIFYEKILKF